MRQLDDIEELFENLRRWRHRCAIETDWFWNAIRPIWRASAWFATGGKGFRHIVNGEDVIRLSLRYCCNAAPVDWEPEQYLKFMSCVKPDSDVLDVGAWIGLFSLGAALRAGPSGRVVAVEPSPQTYRRLRDNIRCNHLEQYIYTVEEVCTDKAGEVVDFFAANAGSMVDSAVLRPVGIEQKMRRKTTTVDELVRRFNLQPELIKIDVEGLEDLVLLGALESLKTYRPMLFIEFHSAELQLRGSSPTRVLNLLAELDYISTDLRIRHEEDPPSGILFQFCSHRELTAQPQQAIRTY